MILRQSLPTLRVTYDQVRSGVTADDNSQALPHLWQCLVFYIRYSFSRHENAQTFALLLVPRELSRSSLIFTPRSDGPRHRFNGCFRATGTPSRNLRFRDGVNFIQISPFRPGINLHPFEGGAKPSFPHAHSFEDGIMPHSPRTLFRGVLDLQLSHSKMEQRAAQPNLHRGRAFAHACKSRREPATSQARRDIK